MHLNFTLVTTVFNEINRLDQTIADIEAQTLKPTEIVIVDAGSNDGTFERLQRWQAESTIEIVVLQKIRCNVAEGRNLAIQTAKYDLIASTDFGCRYHPQWLESLIEPFADKNVEVVGGAFNVVEPDLKTKAARAAYILSNGYNVTIDDNFIPSSRSIAYYKHVWDNAGRYPEWLTLAADDLVFGTVLKKKAYKFHNVDKPYVYWGRHTKAIAYAKEAFRYGLGDGEARVNIRNVVSNFVETLLRYIFFILLIIITTAIINSNIQFYLILFVLPFTLGLRSYLNTFKSWIRVKSSKYNLSVFLYSLYLVELTRINYIKGYYKGWFKSSVKQKEEAKKLQMILS